LAIKITSANDTLVDLYIERAVDLLRLEAGTRNKVLAILTDLEGELVAALAKVDPTGVSQGFAQRKRLEKLLEAVQAAIRASYRDASKLMAAEIREIIDQEAVWTGRAINASINFEFVTGGLTRAGLETIASDVMIQGAVSADWWSRQALDLRNRFADQMRLGIAAGETNADLITRVRGKPGKPGLMDISENSATRLVRTSVQAAANAGRTAMYEKNDDIIASVQWHATLDTRTSNICKAHDGHLYSNDGEHKPKDGGPPWGLGPGAAHWNCRSTSIPVLKTWRDLGIDMDEIPQTTRASMDGQVPAKTTFEDWLGKQSRARQDAALGATVADLWRRGKITFKDLLDQSGRPLTTEQLRAKAERRGK
jgi:SPP1 gp7 family putative phage head morphogenesis protein